jgi:hypothetical protein
MNRFAAFALVGILAAAPAALAQSAAPAPTQVPPGWKTMDMRDDASPWINDPHIHAFYQATIEAFAKGPDHLDRAAFEKKSHEIFWEFAVSKHMKPEAMEEHLKAIPGEVILIVTRDPKTLDSYDSFVLALFGPQGHGPG